MADVGEAREGRKGKANEPDASVAQPGESAEDFGFRDEKGYWRPPYPVAYAPLFQRPFRPGKILGWLFGWPGYLWPINLFFAALAAVTWYYLQPGLLETGTIAGRWILFIYIRNMAYLWIIYGGFHLVLYTLKLHGTARKYAPKWQETGSKKFLFRNQVYDNVFRSAVLGAAFWTGWEVFYFWMAGRGLMPLIGIRSNPVWFAVFFLLIPMWREVHFYLIHKMIHWKPLMRTVHHVHHKNPNPGPWAGLAMHPVELLLYFSVVAIHFIVPSHPIHFLYNSQLTALTPAMGHHGFEGPLFKGWLVTGSYFHYLHHRYVSCNFGEATVPLDKWFGRFFHGVGPYRTRQD